MDLSFPATLKDLRKRVEAQHERTLKIDMPRILEAAPHAHEAESLAKALADASDACQHIYDHTDYALFAGAMLIESICLRAPQTVREYASCMFEHKHPYKNTNVPLIERELHDVMVARAEEIESRIVHGRNYLFDYLAACVLSGRLIPTYTVDDNGDMRSVPYEQPQHMYMRIAIWINMPTECKDGVAAAEQMDWDEVYRCYDAMSQHLISMATPTQLNAGRPLGNLSSCYLLQTADSTESLIQTISDCGRISKVAGGIGLCMSRVRSRGSLIHKSLSASRGVLPWLRLSAETARAVNQSGYRKGAFAVYMEPWHKDVFDFIRSTRPNGGEALGLFTALWVNDEFMRRVIRAFTNNEAVTWTLFDPADVPDLVDLYDDEFTRAYKAYEQSVPEHAVRRVDVRELYEMIALCRIEAGMPYFMFKDAVNRKSNQAHLGTITNSNLCAEIVQFCSPEEHAVCNLASLNLKAFVDSENVFDLNALGDTARLATRMLDRVIDRTKYPTAEARRSNMRHRPVGLGIQGLANALVRLDIVFGSPEAVTLSRQIQETIAFNSYAQSIDLAIDQGHYPSMHENGGAPIAKGKFQWQMWRDEEMCVKNGSETATEHLAHITRGERMPTGPDPELKLDWDVLELLAKKFGVRNSMLTAEMPTASTSLLMRNSEMGEPFVGVCYVKKTQHTEVVRFNDDFVHIMEQRGLWSPKCAYALLESNGNMATCAYPIPPDIQRLFRDACDIPKREYLDMALARAPFIDQSQSFNVYLRDTGDNQRMEHVLKWDVDAFRAGMKISQYYLRTTIDTKALTAPTATSTATPAADDTNSHSDESAPSSETHHLPRAPEAEMDCGCDA